MRRLYDWYNNLDDNETMYLFFCFVFSMSSILVLILIYVLYSGTIGYHIQLQSKTVEINKLCHTNLSVGQVYLLEDNLDITKCVYEKEEKS